jgi:CRP-like cAMP-binding protein
MSEDTLDTWDESKSKPIRDLLISLPIFQGLQQDDLRGLESFFKILDLQAGDTLFKEGSRGNYVCLIIKGALDVIKEVDMAGDVVLSTLSEGRSIGEMSIIDEFPRSATVKARTDATLIILTREDFETISETRPDLGFEILKGLARLLSKNLRKTSARLADYMLPLS